MLRPHLVISLPCRFWRRRPSHAPLVPTPFLEPLLRAESYIAIQFVARVLAVDEVTEAAADATFARVEAAARLTEVCDGAQLAVDRTTGVPARVKLVASFLGRVFVFEASVDVADEI